MSKTGRIITISLLACAIGAVLVIKHRKPEAKPERPGQNAEVGEALPRLVDLGAGKCIPCKMMAPILEELKGEYASTFKVEVIDVSENAEAGKEYAIRMIPTQIFFDAADKELFRHEGFFGKEDILAKWKELGVDVPAAETQ